MPTTTPLDPTTTAKRAPSEASVRVGDLITMLQQEDADHLVYVTRDVGEGFDEVDFQPTSGIERRWYGGRKVVVVR